MIEYTVPKDCKLLSDEEVAKSTRLTRTAPGRLLEGHSYQINGGCTVEANATRNIPAWDGILITDTDTKRTFPVSGNVLVGIGFKRDMQGKANPITVSKQVFLDIPDVLMHKGKTVTVIGTEPKEVTNFQGETVPRTFYLLQKNTR